MHYRKSEVTKNKTAGRINLITRIYCSTDPSSQYNTHEACTAGFRTLQLYVFFVSKKTRTVLRFIIGQKKYTSNCRDVQVSRFVQFWLRIKNNRWSYNPQQTFLLRQLHLPEAPFSNADINTYCTCIYRVNRDREFTSNVSHDSLTSLKLHQFIVI